MAAKIQIPVTSAGAQCVTVPDHFKLADSIQLALSLLGDGYFPLKGKMTVDAVSRDIKDLNGEILPGTGLQVKSRDFVALVDGIVLSDKNKSQFNPTSYTNIALSGAGTWYVCLKAPRVTGSDGVDRPDFAKGEFEVRSSKPVIGSGAILAAKVVVPPGTTQVLSGMIDNSLRDYLTDQDEQSEAWRTAEADIRSRLGQGGSDLSMAVALADTNFKYDALMGAMANEIGKGWVDVFASTSGIDGSKSSGYAHNMELLRVIPEKGSGAPEGAIGYWKMDEPSGLLLVDEAGNQNGLLQVDARVEGKSGNGVSFGDDGQFAFLGYPSNVGLDMDQQPWTVSAWIKSTEQLPSGYTAWSLSNLFDAGGAITNYEMGQWALLMNDGYGGTPGSMKIMVFGSGLGSGSVPVYGDGLWHHIAVTFDPATRTINGYVDGVLDITHIVYPGVPIAMPTHPLTTGASENGYSAKQVVDEVSMWDRALSAEEIASITSAVTLSSSSEEYVPAVVVSNAHDFGIVPSTALVVAKGSGIAVSVSRDDGTTWTEVTSGTPATISGQPSGQAVRVKAVLNTKDSWLDDIAVFVS